MAGSDGTGAATSPGPVPRTASLFACVTTMSNTVLGVSVVGVAGGFSRAGCVVGTCFLILFACLAGSGLHLLARSSMTVSAAAKRSEEAKATEEGGPGKRGAAPPPSSFRAVALVGAPRWAFLIDVAVALKCFGVATSYLVVVGDLMPTAMTDILGESHADSFLLERRFWVTAGFLIAAPLAFSRTLGALKYTATLAISLVVFLAGMVMSFWLLPGLDACPAGGDGTRQTSLELLGNSEAVAQSAGTEGAARRLLTSAAGGMFSPSPAVGGEGTGTSESSAGFESEGAGYAFEEGGGSCFEGSNAVGSVRTILQTLPIFVFCFTCHQNIFTICNEIVRPTPGRVDAVIVCAMLVALATYLSLSWGAYATFGVGVDGDLLETYPRTGLLTVARICVSLLVLSCYPLQAHPSRLCILSTWKAFSADMQEAYSVVATSADEEGRHQQQGTHVESSASSSPDSPSRGHPDILSNISSSSSSNSSSPRDGRGEALLGGERGRRRVVSGPRRIGVVDAGADIDTCHQASTERQAQREAELETLLSGGAPPAGQLDEAVGVGGRPGSNERGRLGDGEAGDRASSDTVDVESTDAVFTSTVRGGKAGDGEEQRQEGEDEEAFWTTPDGFRHVLVTGAFLGLSYAIAMAVGDLGVLLEVVGATGSTTIAFILPGLLYLKVHPEPHPKRSLATLQLAVGLLIIPVALTFIALGESPEGRR